MRTYINFTLALALLFSVGCTVESLEDSMLQENHLITETTKNQPFIIRGYGDMFLTPAHSAYNTECEGYTLIESEGISTEESFGRFTTTTRICTDRDEYHRLTGVHKFPNGDELYFASVQIVESTGRTHLMLVFDGGTGRFQGATGTVDLEEETNFHSATEGTYTNQGQGTLFIGKGI